MSDIEDNLNKEEAEPVAQSFEQESEPDEFENEFTDDEEFGGDEDELEANEGELTPNDIFGLDPLDVLTLEELAEYLQISVGAVRRAVKENGIPGRNIGGEWRFLRDAVANWLRGQEAPAQQQQRARQDYSKSAPASHDEGGSYSSGTNQSYQSEQSGGEYRPRQRFGDSDQQYGGQYGNRRSQFGGGQSGGSYGAGQYGGGQYSQGENRGGYSRPPRRPFRSDDAGGDEGAETGGYRSRSGGGRFGGGGGGYGGGGGQGGQRYGGGPKRKNKRQIFVNERGKRMDRRKQEGDATE